MSDAVNVILGLALSGVGLVVFFLLIGGIAHVVLKARGSE